MGEAERRVLDKEKKDEKTAGGENEESKRTLKGTERFVCFFTKTKATTKKKRDEKKGTVVSDAKKRQNRGDWIGLV